MKKTLISIILVIVLVSLTAVSIYSLVTINKLKNKLNSIEQGEFVNDKYDITTASYFQYYEATDSNFENMIKDVDTYLLYFIGDNEESLQISSLVDIYIQSGYISYSPVILLTKKNASTLFEQYEVEQTPTLLFMASGDSQVASGYQEAHDLLNDIVVTANELVANQE